MSSEVAVASSPVAPPRPRWPVWVALGVAVAVPLGTYLTAYRPRRFLPLGWDIFGYIWQTKAVGHASLSAVGARPGVPVLAAALRSIVPLSPAHEMVVLPMILAAALALAAAGAVRMGYRLSPWALPVVAAVVALWPGTARTLVGYEANLLLLVLVAAGVAVLIQAEGRTVALLTAWGLFAAAALTHIAIFVAFVGVTGLYVLLSMPAFLRDRREGVRLLATDAGGAVVTVAGAGAVGAAALFGLLGVRPSRSINTSSVSFLFPERTQEEIRRIRPAASVPVGLVGAVFAWASTTGRSGRALTRLGVAWMAVAAAGIALSLRGTRVPGARFLLFALPVPVLAGLGVTAVAWLVLRRPGVMRATLAVALVVIMVVALARTGFTFIRSQFSPLRNSVSGELRSSGEYLAQLPGATGAVFVVNQPGPHGAYTPKLRFNIVRTYVPDEDVARTFVFVGQPEDLLAGRPTLTGGAEPWQLAYDDISRQMWAQSRPAVQAGAVILIAKGWNELGFERAVARDPGGEIAPGLYVLHGPVVRVGTTPPAAPLDLPAAALGAAASLALLVAIGWGYAGWGLRHTDATALDRLCLSPAIGAGVGVLGAFIVAAAGGDPAGPLGVILLIALGLAGNLRLHLNLRLRLRRRRRGPQPASPPEVARG